MLHDPHAPWRCSIAARARDDQPIGTAVAATRWLLVGHPGPWARTAAATAPLADVMGRLQPRLDRAGARLQLIRPHGRVEHRAGADQPAFLVDCVTGRVGRASWSTPEDLLELAERFDDLPDVCSDTLVLVCCHAKKDVCCAIEGRLVAAVLDDALPGMVWETTHLGGDRFAGNVAILPEGSMYGRLEGTSAPDVVLGHLEGQVDLDRWRGRTVWDSPEQTAVRDVLAGGVALAEITGATSRPTGENRWEVVVEARGEEHTRTVTRTFSEPRRLTCALDLKVAAIWTVEQGGGAR